MKIMLNRKRYLVFSYLINLYILGLSVESYTFVG